MTPTASLRQLADRVAAVLGPEGFTFAEGEGAVSSGGPFTNGFFVRGPLRIGLIVRGETLGLPVYETNKHNAGHDDIVRFLGHADDALLRWDPKAFRAFASDGSDPIAAFVHDLSRIILPALRTSPDAFAALVSSAHAARLRSWGL